MGIVSDSMSCFHHRFSLLMRGHSDYPLARLGMGAFRMALEAVFKVRGGPLQLTLRQTSILILM
jgi:hypothetical protein